MGFKKPFRAVPVRLGSYHRALERRKNVSTIAQVFGFAVLIGGIAGCLMGLYQQGYISMFGAALHDVAASRGLVRNTPQEGDYWLDCEDARSARVTPLYLGEPGYRPELDRDGDGVACEPYRERR